MVLATAFAALSVYLLLTIKADYGQLNVLRHLSTDASKHDTL